MKIAEIKPRRKSLCGILFDREVDPAEYGAETDAAGWLSLDSELCEIRHLKAGTELTDGELMALVRESNIKRAKSRAMWYLSRGDCAKKALVSKLLRGFPDYAAEAAAERMEELGLLNDAEYAKRRLQRIIDEKKVSLRLAKHMLQSEGVEREDADCAAEDAEYDPVKAIVTLIDRKYRSKLADKKDLERTIAALMRKGYSYSEVREALKYYECETEYCEE